MIFSNDNINIPARVVFSSQAYLSIVSEVSAFLNIETGGMFLGTIENNVWYIIEVIDPGYETIIRDDYYFKYDTNYVNHLANVRYKLYDKELILLGLWHHHPGSMDYFSDTDKETNNKFAISLKDGALSALINVDPELRFTIYHISPDFIYTKINETNIDIGDSFIPAEILKLKDPEFYLNIINRKICVSNEIITAADMLGLTFDSNLNEQIIKDRYRKLISQFHPDKWVNEDDPVITKNASDFVVKLTEAKDILLNYIAEENDES